MIDYSGSDAKIPRESLVAIGVRRAIVHVASTPPPKRKASVRDLRERRISFHPPPINRRLQIRSSRIISRMPLLVGHLFLLAFVRQRRDVTAPTRLAQFWID